MHTPGPNDVYLYGIFDIATYEETPAEERPDFVEGTPSRPYLDRRWYSWEDTPNESYSIESNIKGEILRTNKAINPSFETSSSVGWTDYGYTVRSLENTSRPGSRGESSLRVSPGANTVYSWTDTPDASTSTETVDGVLTRTNLLFTPEPGVAGWYSTSSDAWPGVLAPGEGREGRNAFKTTRTALSPGVNVGQTHYIGATGGGSATLPLVQEGLTYNFSVYTKTDLPSWLNAIALVWYDAGGGVVLSQIQAYSTAVIDSDGWSRASRTSTAPAGAARVNIRSYVRTDDEQDAPEGAQVWFCDGMMEAEPIDTTYAWTGTPHASPSTETIDGVVTRTNLVPNPSAEVNTSGWSAGVSRTTDQAYAGTWSISNTETLYVNFGSLPANSTYTASAWVFISSAHTETVFPRISGIGVGALSGDPITARDEWVRVVMEFTTTSSGGAVYLYPAHSVTSGLRYVDAVMLTEGTIAEHGTYFDGDTADTITNPQGATEFFYGGTENISTQSTVGVTLIRSEELPEPTVGDSIRASCWVWVPANHVVTASYANGDTPVGKGSVGASGADEWVELLLPEYTFFEDDSGTAELRVVMQRIDEEPVLETDYFLLDDVLYESVSEPDTLKETRSYFDGSTPIVG